MKKLMVIGLVVGLVGGVCGQSLISTNANGRWVGGMSSLRTNFNAAVLQQNTNTADIAKVSNLAASAVQDAGTGDNVQIEGAQISIVSTNNSSIRFQGGIMDFGYSESVDLASAPLIRPLDPTTGNMVGDRDYNDARYATSADVAALQYGVTNMLDENGTQHTIVDYVAANAGESIDTNAIIAEAVSQSTSASSGDVLAVSSLLFTNGISWSCTSTSIVFIPTAYTGEVDGVSRLIYTNGISWDCSSSSSISINNEE